MNLPRAGDYINIHTHDGKPETGIYAIENLMAHEERTPEDIPEQDCSFGIHPWFLNNNNYEQLLNRVIEVTRYPNLAAIGEAGFDKLKGPSMELQRVAFEKHIAISEAIKKPVIIHCVRAWDELLAVNKKLHPKMPWLIHGFRGSVELAMQLISKGMYLSFWFDFVLRKESSALLKSVPDSRIFLETDGADVDIREIYKKVADDKNITVEDLKEIISDNFRKFFKLNSFMTLR
jgi:TatD DNase family protein